MFEIMKIYGALMREVIKLGQEIKKKPTASPAKPTIKPTIAPKPATKNS